VLNDHLNKMKKKGRTREMGRKEMKIMTKMMGMKERETTRGMVMGLNVRLFLVPVVDQEDGVGDSAPRRRVAEAEAGAGVVDEVRDSQSSYQDDQMRKEEVKLKKEQLKKFQLPRSQL
jgi:hypothetical protein